MQNEYNSFIPFPSPKVTSAQSPTSLKTKNNSSTQTRNWESKTKPAWVKPRKKKFLASFPAAVNSELLQLNSTDIALCSVARNLSPFHGPHDTPIAAGWLATTDHFTSHHSLLETECSQHKCYTYVSLIFLPWSRNAEWKLTWIRLTNSSN